MRRRSVFLLLVLVPVFLAALPLTAQQPAHTEILRGRVLADSGATPISGADVVAVMAPDRATQATKTDSAGRFELRFPNGTGDYLVHVDLMGWQSWRKRVTRTGADTVLAVDVRLAAKAIALAPITAQAERPRPTRTPGIMPGTGAKEEVVAGVSAAVGPEQAGDLAAMASTIPGVNAVPGGVSVLGLPPSANNATLNGMSFGSGDVPREARTWTRVSTSSFDPARGGFSGAQVSVDLLPGNTFASRRSHLTLDAPQLQYTDPVAARLGQRFTSFQGSLGGDGELVRDKYNYNVALQGSRRTEDATSLLNAPADVLGPAGVAMDSAARFLQILSAQGVPTAAGALPGSRLTSTGSLIARLDHTPQARRSWAVTGYGKLSRADAPFSPIATPAHGGSSTTGRGMLQAEHSLYFSKDYLNLARTSLSLASDRTQPALRLPDGRVLVGSQLTGAPDATGGFASLAFGGNSSLDSDSRTWTWETTDELQFYNRDSRHKIKLFADSRLDGYDQTSVPNRLGSYNYASLADLAANRPASYSRVLSAPRATGGLWSGVLAAGDTWRRHKLSLLLGARLEANHYTDAPEPNPAVASTFGVSNDVAPNRVHVSPRLGFSYNLSGGGDRAMMMVNPVVTRIITNRGVIRGGVGEFRSLLAPTLLSDASVTTGLPDALRRLTCVGPAVPAPDWRALAAGASPPQACADGSTAFADAAPAVRLFDPSYDAARSWRANLGWSGVLHGVGVTLDGIYSLNRGQPGMLDLNFAGAPRFTLPDEGRPVYVSPSAIVPSTGASSPLEARRSAGFGRVLSQRSDLNGYGRQLTATLSPGSPMRGGWYASGAYTLAEARAQWRGFDAAAFGDPSLRESGPSDYDIRHQFQLQAGYATRWLNFSLFGTIASPRPFTPIVGGDVNGDGVAGDRAFVYDPAHAADPALAAGMRSLLATSSGSVRDCLTNQLGQAAARNSCRGRWTQDLRAQIALGNRFPGAGGRLSGSLNLSNPLGGLDQLLHGSGGLHGWGTPSLPDPVLYNVRGFDPATQRFRYEVNPRFGNTRPSATTLRAPFRVTLDFQLDLGKPLPQQQLERSLAPGHRLPANALKQMYTRNVLDIYQQILSESDSLLLSKEQTQALKDAQAKYRTRMDSLWTDLVNYLAALPEHYDGAAALKRQEAATDRGWEITWEERTTIKSILNPLQLRMLPDFVGTIINAKQVPHIRIFIQRG